jgi:hypothetical protein
MSAAGNLFPLLWVLAFLSPIAAIFLAARFYAVHRRRRPEPGRHLPLVAYVLVLLVCAIVVFPFGTFFGISQACAPPGAGNLCGLFGFFVTGPFAFSLAIFLVAGLIALLPADEPASIAAGAATFIPGDKAPLQPKTRWYRKFWHGQYSLAHSFWGFFILGTVVGIIVGMNPVFLFLPGTALIFGLVVLGYQIAAGVGVWRSANATRSGTPSGTYTGSIEIIAAKTVVVLLIGVHGMLLLRTLGILVSYSHH